MNRLSCLEAEEQKAKLWSKMLSEEEKCYYGKSSFFLENMSYDAKFVFTKASRKIFPRHRLELFYHDAPFFLSNEVVPLSSYLYPYS